MLGKEISSSDSIPMLLVAMAMAKSAACMKMLALTVATLPFASAVGASTQREDLG